MHLLVLGKKLQQLLQDIQVVRRKHGCVRFELDGGLYDLGEAQLQLLLETPSRSDSQGPTECRELHSRLLQAR